MDEVFLGKFKDLKSNQLSGGMRRRLSVAISLVGNPKIVFLDEPTTGLDPENRRQLWDILAKCKGGRAMVLTTHSMEEADVLCSRVAIVNDGVLRCIGPQVVLKSLYGGGYLYLSIAIKAMDIELKKLSLRLKILLNQSYLVLYLYQSLMEILFIKYQLIVVKSRWCLGSLKIKKGTLGLLIGGSRRAR